jgi:hypothetical protein
LGGRLAGVFALVSELNVRLNDGTDHLVDFKFLK